MTIVIDDRKNDGALWNSIDWEKARRNVDRLQMRIVKAVKAEDKTFSSTSCRALNGALSMLEPCEVKVSCRVLKGEGGRNASDLPGGPHGALHRANRTVVRY